MTDTKLNELIAEHLGWQREGDFHPGEEDEWEGWRDPKGGRGNISPPDFIALLTYIFPAIEDLLEHWETRGERPCH